MRPNGPYFLYSFFDCCLLSFCPQSEMHINLTNWEQISYSISWLESKITTLPDPGPSPTPRANTPIRPRERTHRFLTWNETNKKQVSYWLLWFAHNCVKTNNHTVRSRNCVYTKLHVRYVFWPNILIKVNTGFFTNFSKYKNVAM